MLPTAGLNPLLQRLIQLQAQSFFPAIFLPNMLSNIPINPYVANNIVIPNNQPIEPAAKPEKPISEPALTPPTEAPKQEEPVSPKQKTCKKWDDECDKTLLQLGVQYKNDWKKVSKRILNLKKIHKTPTFLQNRFKTLRNASESLKSRRMKKYTHEEDLKLVAAINIHEKDWAKIAKYFPDRDPMSLKNRYYYSILKKEAFASLNRELEGRDVNDILNSK